MSEKKVTKREMYAQIADILTSEGYDDLAEFCENEIAALDRKAEKARENAAKKRAEGDALKAAVASALTDEYQNGQTIFEAVDAGDPDFATLGKVRARLTALVKEGVAVKEPQKVEGHEYMGYKLA